MIFLFLECQPNEDAPEFEEVLGAFVTMWIDTDSKDEAVKTAHKSIEEELWTVDELEDPIVVTEKSYDDNPEGLNGYFEAKKEGVYYEFYMYDEEDEDDDSLV